MIPKKILYFIAASIWGIPGIIITMKGVQAYGSLPMKGYWWLVLITLAVFAGFIMMFRRIVTRYCKLIDALPEKTSVWKTFPLRGWVLIVFMMGLGMALKFAGVPAAFTASFYSGLGPALIIASIQFCRKSVVSSPTPV